MKAIRVHEFGGPEVMRLEDVPEPRAGAGEVIVRIQAVGVNPVDTYLRSGLYAKRPALPYTPGTDAAGVIEAVGSGVTAFKPGDRVYTGGSLTGTYAERAVCRTSQVYPLPGSVSSEQGAGIGIPYATAYRALFYCARARPGDIVLVHGASGGVGTAAVQIARAAGMSIIGTAGSERGRALVREQGAHHVMDHSRQGYVQQILDVTGGRGVDVILEMLANVNLATDLTLVAIKGTVVVIGSRGPVQIDSREAMARDARIVGMLLFNATDGEMTRVHAALYAGLDNKTLRPVVGPTFPLAQAPKAHELIMQRGAFGKIILMP